MAVSVSRVLDTVEGAHRRTVTDVTLDSSYPTGGEPLTKEQLGFGVYVATTQVSIVTVAGSVNIANAYYDKTNEKVVVVDETPAEIADTSNVAGVIVRVEARGH